MRGKRPTRRQKEVIQKAGWNPENWLIQKIMPDGQMYLVHRHTGSKRVIAT